MGRNTVPYSPHSRIRRSGGAGSTGGIDPAKHKSFEFNLSARKTADDMWLMWRSTRANTWFVDRAGTLKLAD